MNKTALFLLLALIFSTTACNKAEAPSNMPNAETAVSMPQADTKEPEREVYTMKNYDDIFPFENGFARVKKDGKKGLIDKTGKEILPPQYNLIRDFYEGSFIVSKDNKLWLVDKTGKEVIRLKNYKNIYRSFIGSDGFSFQDELAIVEKGDKWGLIDNKTGKEIVPLKYDEIYYFHEGLAVVSKKRKLWLKGYKFGVIDKTGKEIIPVQYDNASSLGSASIFDSQFFVTWVWGNSRTSDGADRGFSEGLIGLEKDGKWGFLDTNGKTVIAFQYDYAKPFREGLAPVKKDGKWQFIDKTGKTVIELTKEYSRVDHFSQGLAAVYQNFFEYGFIDKTGKEVIPVQYKECGHIIKGGTVLEGKVGFYKNGLAEVEKDGKCGVIDTQGKEVIPPIYGSSFNIGEEFIIVSKIDEYGHYTYTPLGFMHKNGTEMIPLHYDKVQGFSEGFALVKKEGKYGSIDKYGFIDTTGKEIIPVQYDDAKSFSDGLAPVKKGGKWGFVDKTGNEIIPVQYDDTPKFIEGLALVKKDDKYGFIDTTGKEIIPVQYDDAHKFSEGLAAVKKAGIWQVIDKTGKTVISAE